MNTLKIKKLHPDAIIPTRAHETDAGLDIYAAEDTLVDNGTKIPTGIAINIPEGYEGQIRPRSGKTSKTRLRVQLGTIDSGYTGEIKIIADFIDRLEIIQENSTINELSYRVLKGEKIAQLVISPIVTPTVEVVEEFESESARGMNGFGSTDLKVRP